MKEGGNEAILDVDLLAFERGDRSARRGVVDGVRRSLASGFVYTSHDLSEALLDDAYGLLERFFALPVEDKTRSFAPGTHGQTGYTGVLVETAASAERPDWKEMLNWGRSLPAGHPLRARYPHRYPDQVLPEAEVPGISAVLYEFHDRILELQQRFLRIIAVVLGAHPAFFDDLLAGGSPTLSRAIHYPPMASAPGAAYEWAGAHGDINLITALPRATAPGLQVIVDGEWIPVAPPAGHAVINTGIMLERLSNGAIPVGVHRVVAPSPAAGDRYSVVQFCHPTPWTILAPLAACVGPERPQRYGAIEAGDLLDQVLYDINLVEGARRASAGADAEL